jgi:PAS domain S-box-containing protein
MEACSETQEQLLRTLAETRYQLVVERLIATICLQFARLRPDDLEVELDRALQALGEIAGVDYCHISLLSRDQRTISRMYEWHAVGVGPRALALEGRSLVPFQWVMGQLARGKTVSVARLADLPPEASAERALWGPAGIRSVLTLPLVAGGLLRGMLGFSMKRAERTWSEEDIRLLKVVGETLANVLTREQEAYRTLVEHSLQGLAILQDRRIVFANSAIAEMIGHTVEELLSFSPQEIRTAVHAEDRERIWRVLQDDQSRGFAPVRHEFRLIRRDGAVRWAEALTNRVTYQGKPALQISYMDITERKEAGEALGRSLEESARSRRLLLALSEAAQAVERARTPEEVYSAIGEHASILGYDATILELTEDRAGLVVSYLTINVALLRIIRKLFRLPVQGYRFRLVRGGFYQRVLEGGQTVLAERDNRPFREALPRLMRPLAGRLRKMLGVEQGILAPLEVGGEVRGLLVVTGNGLTEADLPTVTTLANQAAIAIENTELLDMVTEQRAGLQRLSVRLMKAQEEERARLSRELHDEIGQALTAMSINLAEIEKRLPAGLVPSVEERLAETSALVEQTSQRISAIALDLRPTLLDDLGLVPAIRWYVSRYSERAGIDVQMEVVDLEERLDPEVETALYRVVQEALTNVARHADATQVRLHLERKSGSATALIEDNGRGFEAPERIEDILGRGAGLVGMQERVALLGGSVTIQSGHGEGTCLSVEIPLRQGDEGGQDTGAVG